MKVGDRVKGLDNEFNLDFNPKAVGALGTVLAVSPQFNPAYEKQEYDQWELGFLVQLDDETLGVDIHGTPHTSWEFIEDWEVLPEE